MTDGLDPRLTVAGSVSPEAAAILRLVGVALAALPPQAPPRTLQDFDAANLRSAKFAAQISAAPLAALSPTLEERTIGGVPVLTVTPREPRIDAAPLVYVHGGAFVSGSAGANLLTAALAAETSGRKVHSIDYTLAPRARWRTILDQVASAWNGIAAESDAPPGLLGDSAGGCIAAAVTLLLRERGATLPGALVLLSPVVDLAGNGDTTLTLAPVDYLDRKTLDPALRAYADEDEWADPLVSPIHADYTPGFPPVLTQVGTREVLLSDAVRLHRRLRAAGMSTRLEVYEGMPHVFQPLLADTPEGVAAWREMAEFWSEHLA